MSLNAGVFNGLAPHIFRTPETPLVQGTTPFGCPVWGRPPDLLQVRVICKVEDNEWRVGAEIDAMACLYASAQVYPAITAGWEPGSLILQINDPTGFFIPKRLTGTGAYWAMTTASWRAVAIATWLSN